MAIPAVTREYNPGSHHNLRKNMRRPPPLQQSNTLFPIKHIRSLDLLDGLQRVPKNTVTRLEDTDVTTET